MSFPDMKEKNELQTSSSGNDESEPSSSLPSPDSATEGLSECESISAKISLDRYEEEWLTVVCNFDLETLKARACDGGLRASRFRSIYWRIYLKILGRDPSIWSSEVTDHRNLYNRLQEELESSPWSASNASPQDNPLSQDDESVWCRYFCDEELRSMIRQDVIRTFPGIDFFHSPEIQNAMIKILFLYARKNPTLCYRQGMHEILAPILFVLHCDQEAFAHAQEMGSSNACLATIFDSTHLAPDAFAIFTRVMSNLESSYAVPKQNLSSNHAEKGEKDRERDNEVVWRLDYIRDKLLTRADPELAAHLQDLDIPLQLFGIRWLRLLFGREFPLQDLLMLWDVVFTTDGFYIVDYIVVAMLLAIRHLLIGRDYTTCLSHVMRYPSGVDITYILQHAYHLLNPNHYPPPPRPPTCPPASERHSRVLLGGFRTRSTHSIKLNSKQEEKERPTSAPLDGFTLKDPERLQSELEHLQAIMSLVRIKISQYYEALQPVVVNSSDPEAFQALEGLLELSNLMKGPSLQPLPDVEPADEVLCPSPSPIKTPQTFVEKRYHAPELEVFKHTLGGGSIDGAPLADPLHRTRHSASSHTGDRRQFYKEFNQLGIK